MTNRKKIDVNETTAQRLSGIIKTCRKTMRKDKGLNGDSDRLPMLTWIMFLKFLDDNEQLQETEAALSEKEYKPAIESPYRWRDWGKDDSLTGDDLLKFISNEKYTFPNGEEGAGLLYYLKSLQSESGSERKDVISSVFSGVLNRMINGYLLRDIINKIDEIHFTSNEEINTLAHLYESILKEMRDASGDAGEYYTPRAVVKFMVEMINPRLGETILDPASGTGGFLVESFEHLKGQSKTLEDREVLLNRSIYGSEAKSLPFLLCQMNLLLHGLEYPNMHLENSLRVRINEIGDSERVDIILTNPPFGGEEERSILNNFPLDKQTTETTLLFLQLIMRKLKRPKSDERGGRSAIVVPNSILQAEGVAGRIVGQLLKEFNVHTIVRLGEGVFAPYTDIPSNLIFFDTEGKTEDIWYYEVKVPEDRRIYSKTKPIKYEEFNEVKNWWYERKENESAWRVNVNDIVNEADGVIKINLDKKNPNRKNKYENINVKKLSHNFYEIVEKELEIIKHVSNQINDIKINAPLVPLDDVIELNIEEVPVEITRTYDFAGVRGFGRGLFKKEALSGMDTTYKVFHKLHQDDLVLSKVKGWEGAIALVTEEFDGLHLSPQYPTFKAKSGTNIQYIAEYCKHPKVWEELEMKSRGIGARRNSVSVDNLLSLLIPLPSEDKQKEIVEILEKVQDFKKLQNQIENNIDDLLPAFFENIF